MDADDDLDDPILNSRHQLRQRSQRRLLVAGIVGGALVLSVSILAIALVIARGFPAAHEKPAEPVVKATKKNSGPANADAPGRGLFGSPSDTANWTYKEMHAHLQSKGLNWAYRPSRHGGVLLFENPNGSPNLVDWAEDVIAGTGPVARNLPWPSTVVYLDKTISPESARQSAGRMTLPVYNYHRWLFMGDAEMVAQVKKVLGG